MSGQYGHRNVDWNLNADEFNWNFAQLGLMMDIRDELKKLNRLLHCANFVDLPRKLDRIAYNTSKPKKRKVKS